MDIHLYRVTLQPTHRADALEELTHRIAGGGDWSNGELHRALGNHLWQRFKAEKAAVLPRPSHPNLAGELASYAKLLAEADRLDREQSKTRRAPSSPLGRFKQQLARKLSPGDAYERAQEHLYAIAAEYRSVEIYFDRSLAALFDGEISESPEGVPRLHYSRSPHTRKPAAERSLVISYLRQAAADL